MRDEQLVDETGAAGNYDYSDDIIISEIFPNPEGEGPDKLALFTFFFAFSFELPAFFMLPVTSWFFSPLSLFSPFHPFHLFHSVTLFFHLPSCAFVKALRAPLW